MCRTVEDCALMFAVMAGYDARDPQTVNVPVPDYFQELERGLEGLRIAVIADYSLTGIEPEVESLVSEALAQLERAGAQVRQVEVPDLDPRMAISALMTVDVAEPAAFHAEWIRERPGDYGEDVRALCEAGELYLATHYIQAQRYRTLVRDQFAEVLRDSDAIVTAAVPFAAPPVEATEVEMADGETLDIITAVMRYNALPPLTGMPAMCVPCGFSADGLPVGMQIVARAFDEGMAFRIGHAYQAVTDWHKRAPELG